MELTLRDSWQRVRGVAKDISLGGMFIETDCTPDFGATVIVTFALRGRRNAIVVSATVRWISSRGIGVQFGPLGASDTYAITELGRGQRSSPPGPL